MDRKHVGGEGGSSNSSQNTIALVRKLEALRLINVYQQQQASEQQQRERRTAALLHNDGGGGVSVPEGYSAMNRNNRKPKKANHGARPCSRYARRGKKRKWGNPRR